MPKMKSRAEARKTRDIWRFFTNYGQGWEYENAEVSYAAMRENKRLYRDAGVRLVVKKGREPVNPSAEESKRDYTLDSSLRLRLVK